MHNSIEIVTHIPLKYKMDNFILILSTYIGNSIRMKRVNVFMVMEWSIFHHKGFSLKKPIEIFHLLDMAFMIENSAESDKMPDSAFSHPSLHSMIPETLDINGPQSEETRLCCI